MAQNVMHLNMKMHVSVKSRDKTRIMLQASINFPHFCDAWFMYGLQFYHLYKKRIVLYFVHHCVNFL